MIVCSTSMKNVSLREPAAGKRILPAIFHFSVQIFYFSVQLPFNMLNFNKIK